MNKEILTEEELRGWIRKIVQQTSSVRNKQNLLEYMDYGFSPDPELFMRTFVEPFTDVLKVAQVASKRVLSAAKLNFDLVTTLSPRKQEKLLADYKVRKEKIDQEMEKVMESTNKALEGGDAQLFGFMLNPGGYLAGKTLSKVPSTYEGTKDFLKDAGFFGGPVDAGGGKEKDSGVVDVTGTAGKLLGDLASLFFIAHHAPSGPLLSEDKKDDEASSSPALVADWIDQAFKEDATELEKITRIANEALDAKRDQFNELKKELDEKRELRLMLVNASNLEEFGEALQKATSSGVDLGSMDPAAIKKNVDEAVEKILNEPKAREELEKKLGIKKDKSSGSKPVEEALAMLEAPEEEKQKDAPAQSGEEIDPELRKQAENVVFTSAKEDMMTQISDGVKDLRKTVGDILLNPEEIVPEKDVKIAKGTKVGREYLDLQDEMLAYIKSL